MTNKLATGQLCVLIRGDVELWVPSERQAELEAALRDNTKRFIRINGQLVNTFEIVGVFDPAHIEERTRRKNGQWKCEKGTWHDRGKQCTCREVKETVKAYVPELGKEITYQRYGS